MKYFLSLAFAVVLLTQVAGAQVATSTLPDPGTLPDSPFYFLKSWRENIGLFFTFDAERKAEQYLHLAEVRLAEYEKMIEKGKEDIAARTLEKYENQLGRALEKAEGLKAKGATLAEGLKEKARAAATKHLDVLGENWEKVPEAAKKGIERALEESKKQMKKLDELFEEAFDDTADLIEVADEADDNKDKRVIENFDNLLDDKGLENELNKLLEGLE